MKNRENVRAGFHQSFQSMRLMLLLISCALSLFPSSLLANNLNLKTSNVIANAGYFQLTWQATEKLGTYQLQQSSTQDFSQVKKIYQGQDQASVLSGYSNGEYFFRVGVVDADNPSATMWSNTVQVHVVHHALSRAFAFFGLGFIVFAATLFAILRTNRQQA